MKFSLKYIWLYLGISAAVLRQIIPSSFIENYYSRGLFLKIRALADSITPQLPFSLFYIFWLLLILLIAYSLRHFFHRLHWKRKFLRAGMSLLNLTGGLVFFFIFLWGFNYKRVPLETQLQLSIAPLSLDELKEEIIFQTKTISEMRDSISRSEIKKTKNNSQVKTFFSEKSELMIRSSLKKVLQINNYPNDGNVNIRILKPKGLLFGFNSSGIYLPFSGEGHIESALPPLQTPFVAAHEMAHGYGFGDEGICNFWAYLACIQAPELFVRYVGQLSYWRYLASEWKAVEPIKYQNFREKLPPDIQSDLNAVNNRLRAYPSFFGEKNLVYDSFLRAQGIDAGLENYNKIIPMVKSYREKAK